MGVSLRKVPVSQRERGGGGGLAVGRVSRVYIRNPDNLAAPPASATHRIDSSLQFLTDGGHPVPIVPIPSFHGRDAQILDDGPRVESQRVQLLAVPLSKGVVQVDGLRLRL